MISFLFLSPQIQDGDHYVKRSPSENHLHAIVIMFFFSEPWNLEYISITNFLIECAYQHKIQHGCHIG